MAKCKICNDTGVYEHTLVSGTAIPVKCFHGAIKYPEDLSIGRPISEHPDVQRLIKRVVELQAEIFIVGRFREMCEESINPDLYSCLVDEIIPALKQSRKQLQSLNKPV